MHRAADDLDGAGLQVDGRGRPVLFKADSSCRLLSNRLQPVGSQSTEINAADRRAATGTHRHRHEYRYNRNQQTFSQPSSIGPAHARHSAVSVTLGIQQLSATSNLDEALKDKAENGPLQTKWKVDKGVEMEVQVN